MRVPCAVLGLLVGCTTGSGTAAGTADGSTGSGGSNGSGGSGACSLPNETAAQTFSAVQAEECNVPGSQGAQHWYRGFGALTGAMEFVQLELWDDRGVFAGTTAAAGTYTIGGSDAVYGTCGVCVRGLGGTTEYFATSGTVDVTAVSATQFAATLTNLDFIEVDPTSHAASGSCTAQMASVSLSGTVTVESGGGGGGGGGGCPTTIGTL